jgi:cytochrome c-type biogenesis protein CcmH/NrfF
VFLIVGTVVVVLVLRRIRASAPVAAPLPPLSDEEEARIRTAMRELEVEDD